MSVANEEMGIRPASLHSRKTFRPLPSSHAMLIDAVLRFPLSPSNVNRDARRGPAPSAEGNRVSHVTVNMNDSPARKSCTTRAAPRRAPRWRSPRRASARSWPGSRFRPASGRPGCWPGRTASDRGRGQARPFGVSDLAAVLATYHRPRRRGRGGESEEVALERGRLDAVIAGLLCSWRDAAQRGERAALV